VDYSSEISEDSVTLNEIIEVLANWVVTIINKEEHQKSVDKTTVKELHCIHDEYKEKDSSESDQISS